MLPSSLGVHGSFLLIFAQLLDLPFTDGQLLGWGNHKQKNRRPPPGAVSPGGVVCKGLVGECEKCRCLNPAKTMVQTLEQVENGCGADWFPRKLRKSLNIFGFGECCNEHDRCYGTCGQTQQACDEVFYNCLQAKCSTIDGWKNYICDATAMEFYGTLKVAGCYTYVASQKKRCTCE